MKPWSQSPTRASPFTVNLMALREAWGLTQHQLANFLGTSRQNVSAWENGAEPYKRELQTKFSILFGIPWDQLSSETVHPLPPRPHGPLEPLQIELIPPVSGSAEIRTFKGLLQYSRKTSSDADAIGREIQKALKLGCNVWVIIR